MANGNDPPFHPVAADRTVANPAIASNGNLTNALSATRSEVNRTQHPQRQIIDFQNLPPRSRAMSHNSHSRHVAVPGVAWNRANTQRQAQTSDPRKFRSVAAAPTATAGHVAQWNAQPSMSAREELLERMARRRLARGDGDPSLRPSKRPKTQHSFDSATMHSESVATNFRGAQARHSGNNYQAQAKAEYSHRMPSSVTKGTDLKYSLKMNDVFARPHPRQAMGPHQYSNMMPPAGTGNTYASNAGRGEVPAHGGPKVSVSQPTSVGGGRGLHAGRDCENHDGRKGVGFAGQEMNEGSSPSTKSVRNGHGIKSSQLSQIRAERSEIAGPKKAAGTIHASKTSNLTNESDVKTMSVKSSDVIDLTKVDKTHVIFAIDFSSSMNKKDVKTSNGKISRWAAVFECVDSFLTQQQQQSMAMSSCLVSVLIFNDDSKVLLKRKPLVGEGNDIRAALERAKNKHRPKGGTGFSAGFQQAEKLASLQICDKVILVFLSDGRPGDLCHRPPTKPTTAMQATFKRKRVTFPAAGYYIERMQKRHNDFSLQLVCLYDEGARWLRYLACRFDGTFHHPDLTLDDAGQQPRQVGHTGGERSRIEEEAPAPSGDSGEDEEVEVMKVKSQGTLIRERCQRAQAAGQIVSLTSTTAGSSIRSTFSSISATVTAMRSSGTKLQERAVTIKNESVMIGFSATRMVLTMDANGVDKFVTAPGESADGRKISVAMHPFAQGGLRNVYRMKQQYEKCQVAKESRHDIKYQERLKFHLETVKCQTQAALYASYFNERIKYAKKKKPFDSQQPHSLATVPRVQVLRAEVYRLKAPSCPGGFRYLAVEDHLEGSYEKWNNNDGFVANSDCIKCKVAQAFSHFSYETSEQQKIVVDIQGAGNSNTCMYTDPQLHSVKKEFGRADRGAHGIDKFFKTHRCNFICKALGLLQRSGSS